MSKWLHVNQIVESVSITHKFHKPQLCFLNTSDIGNGKIINVHSMPIAELKGQAKKTIRKDDILFSEIRPKNKRFAYVDITDTEDFVVSTKLMVLRKFNQEVDNKYFYYFVTSDDMLSKLQSRAENRICSFPQITFELLSEYRVRVPELSEQRKIVNVIAAIDAKMELNNKIIIESGQLLKLLYEYWFIQFDFPDKRDRPYKTSGGLMVYNSNIKRPIPAGWGIDEIHKCCDVIDCIHAKKPEFCQEPPNHFLLQLENIQDNGLINLADKYYVSQKDYTLWIDRIEVKEHDIVVTNAGRVAATAQIPKGLTTGIGRNITAIRPKSVMPTYLFLYFQGPDMLRQIKSNTDTGSFFSSFNVRGIKALHIVRPDPDLEKKFEALTYPLRRRRELLNEENLQLSQLRDWLLPMLMNGQVKVK